MSNIDWDFIGELEGKRKLKGYVPDAEGSKSGVTIATGFDLGARNLSDLAGLPQDIIDVLTPYLGIKGAEASDLASELVVDDSQAKIIDEFSHNEAVERLSSSWESKTGTPFSELPMGKATTIASVAFQYGDLASKAPNFWEQVTTDDWDGAVANLRNFGDNYKTRRNKEAEYFQKKRLEDTLAVTAPADAPSRQLTNEELMAKVQGQIAESKEPVIEGGIKTPIDTEIADFDIAQTNEQRALEQDFYDSPEAVDRTTKSNSMLPDTKAVTDSYTSLYGKSGEVYGNRVQSKFGNEDEYDYAVFDETFDNVWGAAFRQNNFVPAINRMLESMDSQYKNVEGYDAFKDKELKSQLGGDEGLWMFRHSGSPAESQLKLERMKQDAEDMAFLSATDSTGAQVVASLASPTTLLPLAPARVMKMASGGKRFVGGTAFTGAALYPEQMLIESQNEYRDASHSALMLSALSLVGGSLAYKFGGVKRMVDPDMPTGSGGEQVYRSAGASVSPERYRQSMYATMEQDALKETGIGLEKLPWNPVIRMLNSPNPFVRTVATGLVDTGGMMQKKVDEGLSMDQSVESTFRAKYLGPLRQALTEVDKTYLAYRGKVASDSDIARSVQMLRTSVSDKFNRAGSHMTEAQFRNRVARAMRRGDVDNVGDEASEFVTAAAGQYRKVFDLVKKEANSVRLFETQLTKDIAAARAANNVNRVKQLEEAMAKLQEQGVTANNALSYVPRIFRVDKIMERSSEFLSIIERHAVTSMKMSRAAAKTYAQNVMDTVTRSRPYLDLDDAADQLDFMISPSGVKASTLNVPDDLLEEFIENDIETLLRHHVKTMGMDIELTARYGSIDMKSVIDEITADYARLIDEAPSSSVQASKKPPKFDSGFSNMAAFEKHFDTGVQAEVTMFRGSGGGGKVAFQENAFGSGVYLARTKRTAKKYGKELQELSVRLKNPIVFKSDKDLLDYYKGTENSFAYNQFLEVKDNLFKAIDDLNDAISKKKSMKEVRELSDKIFNDKGAVRSLNTSYTLMRRDMMNKVSDSVRAEGYDSAVFAFRQPNFYQATKGDITPSKMLKEYNSARRFNKESEDMFMSLSHDQIVLFKGIDEYKIVDKVADNSNLTKEALNKKMTRDLEDLRGLRDRVRGTYGASKDPHQLSSRFVRVMKSFNVLVGMGGAMISSVPDVFRTTMVEGFRTTNEKGFKNLFADQATYVKKLKQKELAAAGVAVDATLGLRAHSFSDMGDLFGSRYTLERGLNQATGVFFMMNGLNYWNQMLKEFAGNVTMLRMTDALTTTWEALSKADKEKLLKNGIDRQDAYRMRQQIQQHGTNVDGQRLPNTDDWTDPAMRLKFRIALNQNVERIIVTPGAGDRALWTSTEFGSMLTQFKSFGQGAMVRMATAGLQERDGAFWQGATLLVAMGGLVNEVKRAQYGIDDKETFDEKLLNAVDRSGIMGWAMDVNNAVEKLSDNKLGMRPAFTDQPQYKLPDTAKAGAVLGPSASNLMNISSVMGDVVTFNANQDTLDTARFVTPGSTLPYLDPIYDGVFGQ